MEIIWFKFYNNNNNNKLIANNCIVDSAKCCTYFKCGKFITVIVHGVTYAARGRHFCHHLPHGQWLLGCWRPGCKTSIVNMMQLAGPHSVLECHGVDDCLHYINTMWLRGWTCTGNGTSGRYGHPSHSECTACITV